MKRRNQRLRFQTPGTIQLGEGNNKTLKAVQMAKVGTYHHAEYGQFEITQAQLSEIISNFKGQVYGQKIFADIEHRPDKGAAAEITNIYVEGDWLLADMELTDYGHREITDKQHIYLSIDFSSAWTNNQNQDFGAVLFGAGFTTRPFIKGQMGITLAEPTGKNHMTYAERLRAALTRLKATKKLSDAILEKFRVALAQCATDADKDKLLSQYEGIAEGAVMQLSEQGDTGDQAIVLNITTPAATGTQLSETDVSGLVAKQLKEAKAAEEKTLNDNKTKLVGKRKIFTDTIAATELSEDAKKKLSEKVKVVTAGMDDATVKELAEQFIGVENEIAIARQLGGLGLNVAGSPQLSVGADQTQKKLQENIVSSLRLTNAFANNTLSLQADDSKLSPFTQKVLAAFDADPDNAYKLRQEHKMLSGDGSMSTENPWFPVGFQRTVIRELFHDFNIMQLVQTLVEVTEGQTVNIPYEVIDHTQFAGDGVVFEGQGIDNANAGFTNDLAYVLAMKLGMKVSNEVMHFTRTSGVNWEAWAENISSNLRIMRTRITRRLANEIQRASDAYLAADITTENVASQLTGTVSTFKTAQFPIVRPHQQYDMRGNAIGNAENPITVTLAGTALVQWNGTGKQAAGTYYHLKNLNLGYVQFVTEAGVAVTPDAAATATISYSYSTNIVKFDLNYDTSKTTYKQHLNGLLDMIGDQKSMLSTDRYVMPEYLLMAPALNNEITKATDFVADQKRNGTDTSMTGDLEKVKGVAAFGTNAPNLDLGSERIHLGQRNTTTYKIVKPYSVGQISEAVNGDGKFTGQKMAYGEEYSAIHTPKPVRNRSAGVIVYNSTTR